jgi:PAS domain S-box-containing protein
MLLQREREFRSLAENLPDNIARWDREGRYVYINPTHELTLQTPAAEVLGKRPSEIFPDGRFDHAEQVIVQVGKTGHARFIRVPAPQDDGTLRIHEVSYAPERNAQGEIVSVLGIGRDMTGQIRLQESVIQSEAALRSLTDSAPFSIIRYDIEGRITYVNAPLLGYFGIALAELIGKLPREVWTDGQFAEIDRGLAQVLETKAQVVVEFSESDAEGKKIHHQVWLAPEKNASNELIGIIAFGFNITERRRAEREAHLLNHALDNSFDATYLHGSDLRFRYVNEAAVRALGYSREELLSLSVLDIDPNVTREIMQGIMQQTPDDGHSPGVFESSHRRKNGKIFPIEIGATKFSYEGETLFQTVVRDITERKRLEQQLQLKEFAIEHAQDAIFLIDNTTNYRFIYVNEEACRSLGYSRDELLGFTPRDIDQDLTPEDAISLRENTHKGFLSFETRHRRRDGSSFPVELRSSEFDFNGQKMSMVMARDITVRKRMEQDSIQRESELRSVMESSPDTIIRYDREGRIAYANSKLLRMFGTPTSSIIGKLPHEVWPDRHFTEVDKAIFRVLETKVETRVEVQRVINDALQVLEIRLAPELNTLGEIIGVIAFGRNITALRLIEKAIEESHTQLRGLMAQREQAREEERKLIAREIHDELGQILGGLHINIGLVAEKCAAHSEKLREHFQESVILINQAIGVTRNVAATLRPVELDMGIAISLEWLVNRFAIYTGIQCELYVEDLKSELDEANVVAFFRIVQESLTNVARHAQASKLSITLKREGDDMVLKIHDNGRGFEMSEKKVDSFGLVGMRERTFLLRGSFSMNSRPGDGTEIVVSIPLSMEKS